MENICQHKWSTWEDYGFDSVCTKCGDKREPDLDYDWRKSFYKDDE